jgi:cyclase
LDVRNEWLIKPVNLEGVRRVGDPHEYAVRYASEGIDELLYVDCVASLYGRNGLAELVERVACEVFTPITVAGGIRSVEDAHRIISGAGADKVAVNTAAVKRPELLTEIARKFGSQAVVLQIDAKRKGDGWEAYCEGGRQPTRRDAIEWAKEGIERGAGEILLTSIDQEGTRKGADSLLVAAVVGQSSVTVPVVYSGGLGSRAHAVAAVLSGASAVASAHVLHYRLSTVSEIKQAMSEAGVPTRLHRGVAA